MRGVEREKWWSPINTPVLGPHGHVEWIIRRVEDMTEFVRTRPHRVGPGGPGDTLVLYTDGLVERRGEDIDAGLDRLTGALARHAGLEPGHLADTQLARLGVADGGPDDIALVVVRR